jgi:Flp pilus assembly protein TadG
VAAVATKAAGSGKRPLGGPRAQGQRGSVVIITALFLVGLLGFTAIAVDVGYLAWQKRELQNIADAAALAGAQELPNNPDAAVNVATDYARRNGVGSGGWVLQSVEVLPSGCTPSRRDCTSLRVRVAHPDAPFFLGRVLGFSTADVTVTAQAAIQSPTSSDNGMPWALKDSVRQRARYGDVVTIKYSAKEGEQGNYGALAIPNDHCRGQRGAALYRCNIENGARVEVGRTYDTEPGNMTGPTRQGLQARLDSTDPRCDSFSEVFEQLAANQWRFRDDRCNPWSDSGQGSKRVVLIPVIADVDLRGRSQVEVIGFALAFLEDFSCPTGNDCDVNVRFVHALMSADDMMRFGSYNSRIDIVVPRLTD